MKACDYEAIVDWLRSQLQSKLPRFVEFQAIFPNFKKQQLRSIYANVMQKYTKETLSFHHSTVRKKEYFEW